MFVNCIILVNIQYENVINQVERMLFNELTSIINESQLFLCAQHLICDLTIGDSLSIIGDDS